MSNTLEETITTENIGDKWNQKSFKLPSQY